MKRFSQSWLLVLPVILIVFGLSGCGNSGQNKNPNYTESGQNQKTPAIQKPQEENAVEKQTPKEIDTSDWQTYRNEEYGFEVKCPKDWTLRTSTRDYVISLNSPQMEKLREKIESGDSWGEGYMEDILISVFPSIAEEPENELNNLGAKNIKELTEKNQLIMDARQISLSSGTEAWEMTRGGFGAYYTILAENSQKNIFQIMFGNKSQREMLDSTEEEILRSFKIIE